MPMPNQTHDVRGRAYAKLSELQAGDTVELDNHFTCMSLGRVVLSADKGGVFFNCKDGNHYLSGQADDGEHCVGVYKIEK